MWEVESMARKILRQFVVAMPVNEVIKQLLQEGWKPISLKADGGTFKMAVPVLERVSKAGNN
jgi:hypothetical protein